MLNLAIQYPFVTMFTLVVIIALVAVIYGLFLIRRDENKIEKEWNVKFYD